MDPSTGRFITMDPYAGSIFDPTSLHKYLYANANPVMYSDPTGNITITEQQVAMAMDAILAAAFVVTGNKLLSELTAHFNPSNDFSSLLNKWQLETFPVTVPSKPNVNTLPTDVILKSSMTTLPISTPTKPQFLHFQQLFQLSRALPHFL